jgi:hypothetical protein
VPQGLGGVGMAAAGKATGQEPAAGAQRSPNQHMMIITSARSIPEIEENKHKKLGM